MACELKVRAAMAYELGADCDWGSNKLLWTVSGRRDGGAGTAPGEPVDCPLWPSFNQRRLEVEEDDKTL